MELTKTEALFFASPIEKSLYECIDKNASGRRDYDCNGIAGACIEMHLDDIIEDWANNICHELGAFDAGIPISVIKGEKRLDEVFSQDYLDFKFGKKRQDEEY